MKTLTLIIKQEFFDEILAGTKKQEFREIKPTTISRLLQLDADGYEIIDEDENSIPIKYDAIRFYVGYHKDRDTALVAVKGAHCEIYVDENDNVIEYDYNGQLWVVEQVVYDLGEILEKKTK